VPRQLVLECIALSQQAPTPVNSQTWHWVMVSDSDTRAAIGGIYLELHERSAVRRADGRGQSSDSAGAQGGGVPGAGHGRRAGPGLPAHVYRSIGTSHVAFTRHGGLGFDSASGAATSGDNYFVGPLGWQR
jgi:nitroreductase